MELRFGIGRERPHGRPEVARLFRLSQERIRQIEEGALRRLRSPMLGVELESFL
ncbi:MAG TPA: sigma factor-like helix-turn-helix DNA-binding protein [Planctomycetota bacterium]|nr:sigma factor-like helix-turn-helix DNA-binding protein [Planctomycetota bacterium]